MNHLELITVYKEALFETPSVAGNILFRAGLFEQKVLVLINSKEWNQADEEFLKKILQSCRLNDNDYLIIVFSEPAHLFDIINQHRPEILFLFGVKLESDFFNSHKSPYKPFVFNGIKIAISEPLKVLQADKEKRLLLWNQCIKPLFNID